LNHETSVNKYQLVFRYSWATEQGVHVGVRDELIECGKG
jgi:hypothetical protein